MESIVSEAMALLRGVAAVQSSLAHPVVRKRGSALSNTDEIGNRANRHLRHDAAPMYFHRLLRDPELGGNLFVQATGDDASEDLAFPWGQACKPETDGGEPLVLVARATI